MSHSPLWLPHTLCLRHLNGIVCLGLSARQSISLTFLPAANVHSTTRTWLFSVSKYIMRRVQYMGDITSIPPYSIYNTIATGYYSTQCVSLLMLSFLCMSLSLCNSGRQVRIKVSYRLRLVYVHTYRLTICICTPSGTLRLTYHGICISCAYTSSAWRVGPFHYRS